MFSLELSLKGISRLPAPEPASGSSGDAEKSVDPPPSGHLSPRCVLGLMITPDGSLAGPRHVAA